MDHQKGNVGKILIEEHSIKYEVNFKTGHKTGFFCDQRENRFKISKLVQNSRVLDLCCYTGGFSICAAMGGAKSVIAVDLDENAIAQAEINAELNQVKGVIRWVHADAFKYGKQLRNKGKKFDVVILDPPKFIASKIEEEAEEGMSKYEDLNEIAVALVDDRGLFVTCSCSGLLSMNQFESLVIKAAHKQNKYIQILDKTGASQDHPVMSNCPESLYLKVIWARVCCVN